MKRRTGDFPFSSPSIEVDTMAGAFNQDKLAFGVPVVEFHVWNKQ